MEKQTKEELVELYLIKIGLPKEDVVSMEKAVDILNEHTIGFYKGRFSVKEDGTTMTIQELAETLADVDTNFQKEFAKGWAREMGDMS